MKFQKIISEDNICLLHCEILFTPLHTPLVVGKKSDTPSLSFQHSLVDEVSEKFPAAGLKTSIYNLKHRIWR